MIVTPSSASHPACCHRCDVMSCGLPRVAVALVTFATFTDIVAYSIAVPVLPDLSRRLGASPTMIGLLFASFGVTLLTVSMPMGAMSDRVGPQGAARRRPGRARGRDAALRVRRQPAVALRRAARAGRGRRRHLGRRLRADRRPVRTGRARARHRHRHVRHQLRVHDRPVARRLALRSSAACACRSSSSPLLAAVGAVGVRVARACPPGARRAKHVPIAAVLRDAGRRGVRGGRRRRRRRRSRCSSRCCRCILQSQLGARSGAHRPALRRRRRRDDDAAPGLRPAGGPVGRAAPDDDRARALTGCVLPLLGRAWSFESAVALYVLQAAALALVITPSLAYMAEATSAAGLGSFGVAYGLYNVAWGVGPARRARRSAASCSSASALRNCQPRGRAAIVLATLAAGESKNPSDPGGFSMTRARISDCHSSALWSP